jgi:hypothetical protein
LQRDDPLVNGRCPFNGLIVRAADDAETVVLDLNGLSIVGSGVGTGIEVHRGGSEGAAIRGGTIARRGEVVGFGVGIKARTPQAIRRIESVEVEGQRQEGLMLRSAGVMVFDVAAVRNGSDGIRVVGQGGRLLGVEAIENGGAGLRIFARDLIIEARAEGNRRNGIVLSGLRNDLTRSVCTGNRGYGVLLGGKANRTEGVVAEANTIAGIGYRGGSPP